MSDPSPPNTASKRAASPLSPDEETSSKRAREDTDLVKLKQETSSGGGKGEGQGDKAAEVLENGHGVKGESGVKEEKGVEGKKMDDVNMEG